MMKTKDPVVTAWFPPERADMIYNRHTEPRLSASNSFGKSGLNQTQKIWLWVGVTVGILAIIGIILGAVLGTQLNKGGPEPVPFNTTTQAPTTTSLSTSTASTVAPPPDSGTSRAVEVLSDFKMDRPWNEKLLDKNSDEYKTLADEVCNETKQSVPPEEVDTFECDEIDFSQGSVRVRVMIKITVKKTVTVTLISYTSMVQTRIEERITQGPLKATNVTMTNPKLCNPNPCKFAGVCVDGGNNEFKCQCKSGKYGKTCDDGPSFCHCSGDPHCKTFDGLTTDYHGTCKFIFVQELNKLFTVYLRNINLKGVTKVAWARYIELHYKNFIVRMGQLDAYHIRKIGVTVNGVKVTTPYQNNDLDISMQGDILVCQTKFGMIVSYGKWKARVGLPPSYKKKVTGFCGNFDGNKKNDATTRIGEYVFTKPNFGNIIGNSYVVKDSEKQPYSNNCILSDDDVNPPPCVGVDLKKALYLCQQIKNTSGKFKPCVDALPPEDITDHFKGCEFDVKRMCHGSVATTAISTFVQECYEFESILVKSFLDWKKTFNITKEEEFDKCPGGSIYAENSTGCVNTCKNPQAASKCNVSNAIDSCVCPEGTVLFMDQCVQPSKCGCIHSDGSERSVNEVWYNKDCSTKYTCTAQKKVTVSKSSCEAGQSCVNSRCTACEPVNPCKKGGICSEVQGQSGYKCQCPPGYFGATCDFSYAFCECHGDPHCKSFDGQMFDYQGTRKHKLVEFTGDASSEKFVIFGKNANAKGNTRVAWVFYVEMLWRGKTIRFSKAYMSTFASIVVTVDSKKVEIPYQRDGLNLTRNGEYVEFNNNKGLMLSYSSKLWRFKVQLSADYFGKKLTGLCGNFDGDKENDKKKADGTLSTGKDIFVVWKEIGDSYVVDDDPEDTEKLPTPVNPTPPSCDQAVLNDAARICAHITSKTGPFGKCISNIPADELKQRHDWCLYDARLTCDPSFCEDSLALLAETCLQKDIVVEWRRVIKKPCRCGNPEMSCLPLTASCIPSCQNPTATESCSLPQAQDVCSCNPGKIMLQDKCVFPPQCGCVDELGVSHKVGDVWMDANCNASKCVRSNIIENISDYCKSKSLTCKNGKCVNPDSSCSNDTCSGRGGKCTMKNDGNYSCICRPGFTGSKCDLEEATCSCHGDIHCTTFDRLPLDYQGLCRFVLANSIDPNNPFTVFGQSAARFAKDKVSWILYVEIQYKGKNITIGRKSLSSAVTTQVDGKQVTRCEVDFGDFKIYSSGKSRVFETLDRKLRVSFSKEWKVDVVLTPAGGGKVEGLCGNNNGNKKDDNRLKDGTELTPGDHKKNGKMIGDSFVVPDKNSNIAECTKIPDTPPSPPCSASQVKLARALCEAISDPNGVFSVCFPRGNDSTDGSNNSSSLDIPQLKDWCDFDFIETCQPEAAKASVTVFAELCIEEALKKNELTVRRNVTINSTYTEEQTFETEIKVEIEKAFNYRAILNMTIECDDPNAVYSTRSSGCAATCENPNSPSSCTLPDALDHCVCSPGFLLFRDSCVLPDDCGCISKDSAHGIGESWLTDNCSTKWTCKVGDNGTYAESNSTSCPTGTQCTKDVCSACASNPCKNGAECVEVDDANSTFVCKCRPGYQGKDCGEMSTFGSCSFFGNGHWMTFDGLPLDCRSTCRLKILEATDFIVYLMAQEGDSSVKLSYVEINLLSSVKVRLAAEKDGSLVVYRNATTPIEPPLSDPEFSLSYVKDLVEFKHKDDLTIQFNGNGVDLKISSNLRTKVKGMCGNFDGKADNDLETSNGTKLDLSPDGTVAENVTKIFADSFIDRDGGVQESDLSKCYKPTKQPSKPDCSFDVLSMKDKCAEFKNPEGIFKECMSNFTEVQLNQTEKWCFMDVDTTCNAVAVEAIFDFHFKKCQEFIKKSLPSLCKSLQIKCKCSRSNTELKEEAPACPASCVGRTPSECRMENTKGTCACKDGYVLFKGKCIPAGNCGCVDKSGRSRDNDESWMNDNCTVKYTCISGEINEESFNCSKTCTRSICTACKDPNQCPDGRCMDADTPPGYFCRCNPGFFGDGASCKKRNLTSCSVHGDPHFKSFDDATFSYQGLNKYILVASLDATRPITIYGKNFLSKPGEKVSWLDYVEIVYSNKTFKLRRAYVGSKAPILASMNGSPMFIPFTSKDGDYNITYDGDAVRFITSIGVSVIYMPAFRMSIEVIPYFANKLTGVCGNFDNSPANDMTVHGFDVSSQPDPGNAVGNSFVDKNAISPGSPPLSPDITPPKPCPQDISEARLRCQMLGDLEGPFGVCLKKKDTLEVQTMVNECLFDLEQTCDVESVKTAFFVLMRRCYHGYSIQPPSNVKELECNCTEPNTVCQPTSTGCPATCANPTSPDNCPTSDSVLACVCKHGMLLSNGKCVLPRDCGCVYTDGRVFEIDESWLSNDCKLKLTCKDPGVYSSAAHSCPSKKTCVEGACLACTKNPCGKNGECIESDFDVGFVCKCKKDFFGPTCNSTLVTAVYSNTHCKTFDGAAFDFNGTGSFLLFNSQRPVQIEILLTNVDLDEFDKVSYCKTMTVKIPGNKIVVDKEDEGVDVKINMKVNDNDVDIPYKKNEFEVIWNTPTMISIIIIKFGFICTYNARDSTVTVSVATTFLSTGVTGLCGNFDGNEDNDLVTSDGQNVTNSTDPGNDIGLSYTNTSSPEFKNLSTIVVPKCRDASLREKCNLFSSLSGPLKPAVMGLREKTRIHEKNCMSDVERSCSKEAFCLALLRLAMDAASVGVQFDWMTPFDCKLECSDDFVPKPFSSGCLPTCQDPTADKTCALPDLAAACVCPPGRLFFKQKCVDAPQCGCSDASTGKSYEVGESWRNQSCATRNTCELGGNVASTTVGKCSLGTCVAGRCSSCQLNPCKNGGTCMDLNDEGVYLCRCPANFYGRRCDGFNNQADIVILVEDSFPSCRKSTDPQCVASSKKALKDFVKKFVDGLLIGPGDVRISLVFFISDIRVLVSFDDYTEPKQLENAIDSNMTTGGNQTTDLANALETISNLHFGPDAPKTSHPALPPVPKIIIALTDGGTAPDVTVIQPTVKKLDDERIKVCGIGLSTDVKKDILKEISFEPKKENQNFYLDLKTVDHANLKKELKLVDPAPFLPSNESTATCRCHGDPHCNTFDKQQLSYQGTCETLMASNENTSSGIPTFYARLRNFNRNGNKKVSWVKYLEFEFAGKFYKFQRVSESFQSPASVTVGGVQISIPYVDEDFSINYNKDYVEMKAIASPLVVAYSSAGVTYITIPSSLKNTMFGLCGNYDGNPDNDFKTRGGVDVSKAADPGKEVGDSYIEYQDPDNFALLGECKPPVAKNQTCSAELNDYVDKCKEIEKPNGAFKECFDKYPSVARMYARDCLFDLLQTCDPTTVGPTLTLFARACFEGGVHVKEWRDKLDLPCECPSDKKCRAKGSCCMPTAANPKAGKQCHLLDTVDVCSCPFGKVVFNGVCTSLSEVGCVDGEGGSRKLGESWLSDDCLILYTCASSSSISTEAVSCPDQTTCVNGKCSACLYSAPCQNGGSCAELSECQPKSPTNPGCYWKKIPNTRSTLSLPSPSDIITQCDCIQAAFFSTSRNIGYNWDPSQPPSQRCSFVPSLSTPAENNKRSTQYLWVCEDKTCPDKEVSKDPPSTRYKCACKKSFQGADCGTAMGTCTLDFGVQVETFDGRKLLYRTGCKTTLSKLNARSSLTRFSVALKNLPHRDGKYNPVRRSRMLEVTFRGLTLLINLPEVGHPKIMSLKGSSLPQLSPPFEGPDFSLDFFGKRLELQIRSGPKISFGPGGKVVVNVPPQYDGQLEGICGDYNGDEGNDGNSTKPDSGNELSRKYFVPDEKNPSPGNCSVKDLDSTNVTSTTNKLRCQAIVDAGGPFSECLVKLERKKLEKMKEACELNVDMSLDETAACPHLEGLVDLCNSDAAVILTKDWKKMLGCKCDCARGFVCSPMSSACPATCGNPDAPKDCLDPDVQDACVCPPGKLLFGDRCVWPGECGCVDKEGKAREISDQWLNNDCSVQYECSRDAVIKSSSNVCPPKTVCRNNVCSVCSENNPCKNGECVDVVGSDQPICRCPHGFVGKFCEIDNHNTCDLTGIGHCRTFDGARLDFKGDCRVVLIESIPPLPPFKVYGRNYKLNKNAFFLKYVEVERNNDRIRIEKSTSKPTISDTSDVTINGQLVELPAKKSGMTVQYLGQKVVISLDIEITVIYENSMLSTNAPDRFAGNLKGLCGNFNGDESDDNVTSTGRSAASGQEVADSYNVLDPDSADPNRCLPPEGREPPRSVPIPSPTLPPQYSTAAPPFTYPPFTYPPFKPTDETDEPEDVCPLPQADLSRLVDSCSQLDDSSGIFGECLKKLNAPRRDRVGYAARNCKIDIEAACDEEVLHYSFQSVAGICFEVGVNVKWTAPLNISYTCPVEGMTQEEEPKSPCMATCGDPKAPRTCAFANAFGVCTCPPGEVLLRNKCTPRSMCGCTSDEGKTYNVGSTWFESNCSVRKTCSAPGEIKTDQAEPGVCDAQCSSSSCQCNS